MAETQDKERRTPKLLPAFLLLLLGEGERYGGELVTAFNSFSEPWSADRGAVYRSLHDLEEAGQVTSYWEPSPSAPPRRFYRITQSGWQALAGWDREIAVRRRNLARFARTYRRLTREGRP